MTRMSASELQAQSTIHFPFSRMLMDILIIVFLMGILFCGDYLFFNPILGIKQWIWATPIDPSVHALVALVVISPIAFSRRTSKEIINVLIMTIVLAVFIDLDHIAAAGSFSLYAITHLYGRPFTHSIVFSLVAGLTMWLITRQFNVGWITFAALSSHVIRDASMGATPFFIWPLPFEQALPVFNYFGLEICLYLSSAAIAALSIQDLSWDGIHSYGYKTN